MKPIRIGVDLAKNVFQLHGVDRDEKAVFKRRLKRDQWLRAVFDHAEPGCEIGMDPQIGYAGGKNRPTRAIKPATY